MTVQEPDSFPETGASATHSEALPEKYLDVEALTCRYVAEVISGNADYNDRFVAIAGANQRRARRVENGQQIWEDCIAYQCYDVTDDVRHRVDQVRT